jgi:hypothetical protein
MVRFKTLLKRNTKYYIWSRTELNSLLQVGGGSGVDDDDKCCNKIS